MMAEQVAEHLGAKRAGRGRWMGKCPAHRDRMPSLSIGTGSDGRTLLNCHAGCSVDAVLKASGLSTRDLFAGPPLSRNQLDERAAKRDAEEENLRAETAMIRSVERLTEGQLQQLDLAVNFLGAQLMIRPDDDSLAGAFDQVLQEFRRVESIAIHLGIGWIGAGRWIEPPGLVKGYDPMVHVATVFKAAFPVPRLRRKQRA